MLPGFEVTVYLVIALPPLEGAVQLTVTWPFPANPATPVGAPGTVAEDEGTTAAEVAELRLVPTALVAVTVNV